MTDRRSRERTLPKGYQFGDAADGARVVLLEADEFIVGRLPAGTTIHRQPWRPPHENAAEQLAAKAEPPDPPPGFLDQLKAAGHWNVIEGEDH